MKSTIGTYILLIVLGVARGLDVEVESVVCDESLPVTADLSIKCNGKSRCTFGNSTTISGTIHYSGIGNTGVQDNVAYMSAKLKLWSMDFNLLDMMQVPLCDETMTADESNENECPGDGSHNYALDYKLPSAGNGATSWVASGWEGSGLVQMFAEPNEDMLIGECTLILRTYVTKSNTDTLELTPSASQTAGIVLAVAAMLALLIFWCYCCRRKKQNKIAVKDVESDETSFKRMEDERSFWSGLGSRASKKSATSKKTEANSEALSIVSELQ